MTAKNLVKISEIITSYDKEKIKARCPKCKTSVSAYIAEFGNIESAGRNVQERAWEHCRKL